MDILVAFSRQITKKCFIVNDIRFLSLYSLIGNNSTVPEKGGFFYKIGSKILF